MFQPPLALVSRMQRRQLHTQRAGSNLCSRRGDKCLLAAVPLVISIRMPVDVRHIITVPYRRPVAYSLGRLAGAIGGESIRTQLPSRGTRRDNVAKSNGLIPNNHKGSQSNHTCRNATTLLQGCLVHGYWNPRFENARETSNFRL